MLVITDRRAFVVDHETPKRGRATTVPLPPLADLTRRIRTGSSTWSSSTTVGTACSRRDQANLLCTRSWRGSSPACGICRARRARGSADLRGACDGSSRQFDVPPVYSSHGPDGPSRCMRWQRGGRQSYQGVIAAVVAAIRRRGNRPRAGSSARRCWRWRRGRGRRPGRMRLRSASPAVCRFATQYRN